MSLGFRGEWFSKRPLYPEVGGHFGMENREDVDGAVLSFNLVLWVAR